MQAPRSMPPARLVYCAAASITLLFALTACGLKGPLYMPPPAAPDASLTTPPAPARPLVPAPDDDISANTPTTSPVK